jgi:hypothetical protein
MDPLTAMILIGSTLYTQQQSQEQARLERKGIRQQQEAAQEQALQNQNALVEEGYRKKQQARGLGGNTKSGLVASQTGSVLTSVTNGNEASGL